MIKTIMAEEKFLIQGGKSLRGVIETKGAKNAALKIFIASLLSEEDWEIKNVPEIDDIYHQIALLKDLGARVKKLAGGHYKVGAKNIKKTELNPELTQKIR